ncbi:MAG TPA: GrpB family protein [Nocardioides sp.]|nr:GrpB family protein [Nocardioides sp.]
MRCRRQARATRSARSPGLFLEVRGRIDIALADVAHVTEHDGSTAVPGLDAKPIIDVDVVVTGSQPHRDHVDLRDFLRAHPAQAARYGELKRRLAGLLATDRLAYGEGKAERIAEFLRRARTRPGRSLPTVRCVRE